MSHVVVAMRGQKEFLDKFTRELNSQYLPFKYYDKKKKKLVEDWLQVRMAPVRLYDISFPDEHKDRMLNTIFQGNPGTPQAGALKKFVWGLRKALRLKKIPKYDKKFRLPMLPPQHIEMIGIGVKDDYWVEPDGKHVKKSEKSDLAYEGI